MMETEQIVQRIQCLSPEKLAEFRAWFIEFDARIHPTYGCLLNFNPHVQVLAADGAFLADARFVARPWFTQSTASNALT